MRTLLCLALLVLAGRTCDAIEPDRPNVLLILGGDHAAYALGADWYLFPPELRRQDNKNAAEGKGE